MDLKKEKVLGTGSESAGLYIFDVDCDKFDVSKLLKNSLNLSNVDHNSPCEVCHKAKQTRDAFPISEHKSTCLGELVHLDVWGPYKVTSREGFRYFLTIVDDFMGWIYHKKDKNKAKRTKPSTEMERARKAEAEGVYILNGPTRTHFNGPVWIGWTRLKIGEHPRVLDPSSPHYKRRPPHTKKIV
ncbi:ribonuclease H-like domain-containing protein [Tanacetum coccineum]